MIVVVESVSGAQILPRPTVQHPRRMVTEWQAVCALDADARTKREAVRDLAARLSIHRAEGDW